MCKLKTFMKMKNLIIGVLVLTILSLGCLNQKVEIEFETIEKGLLCSYGTEVIAKEERYEEYSSFWAVVVIDEDGIEFNWRQVTTPSTPHPTVDFEKYIMIIVFQGLKKTGGYSIEIKDIYQIEDEVYIDVEIIEPGEGEGVTQAFSSPVHAVLIDKSQFMPGTLKFIFRNQNGDILQEITKDIS